MSMPFASRLAMLVSAGVVGITACAGESSAPTSAARAPGAASFALGTTTDATPVAGQVKLCKSASSNVSGAFTVTLTGAGAFTSSLTLAPGACSVVAEDMSIAGSSVTVVENPATGLQGVTLLENGSTSPSNIGNTGNPLRINQFHGFTVTFTNFVEPAVCDFITFGRLVTELNGQKVVISGNAGGNAPGGGFLNEFHVEANGVDNHVADITTYGPIASGPLSGPLYPNSRMAIGTAKNGVLVEIRMWDGGEPGKGTDKVYVKLGTSSEILGPNGQFIDQGNMQYHANCRGPKS
jgi:hypothetical protein